MRRKLSGKIEKSKKEIGKCLKMVNFLGNPVSCQQRDQLHSPEYMKQSETNHTINPRSFIHV